jgi:precorrin-6A/cobalt-precorrin-6A reductase
MSRLLILGGTADAVSLARQAADLPGLEVTYSLAGVTADPNLPDCTVRRGGFEGAGGLASFLQADGIDIVLDATHPFASRIAANAALACKRSGVARLKYLRPAWSAEPGDHWRPVAHMAVAAKALARFASRAFLTIGAKDLGAFADLAQIWFLVRLMEPPGDGIPLADYQLLQGRGPFGLADEKALMVENGIDALVSKNSGGVAVAAKLRAARELGVPVVMIERPAPPPGEIVETPQEVLDWIMRSLSPRSIGPA